MKTKNILFVHIPRTAGTHLEKCLGFTGHDNPPRCGSRKYGANYEEIMGWDSKTKIMLQHATYKQMIQHGFVSEEQRLIKISIVRNPYPRAVSLYHYFGGKNKHGSFGNFLSNLEGGGAKGYFYMPQHKYLEGGEFNLIRFENFKQDIESINEKFNLNIQCDFDNSRHDNSKVSEFLTEQNIEKINNLYRKDFEVFDYPRI